MFDGADALSDCNKADIFASWGRPSEWSGVSTCPPTPSPTPSPTAFPAFSDEGDYSDKDANDDDDDGSSSNEQTRDGYQKDLTGFTSYMDSHANDDDDDGSSDG